MQAERFRQLRNRGAGAARSLLNRPSSCAAARVLKAQKPVEKRHQRDGGGKLRRGNRLIDAAALSHPRLNRAGGQALSCARQRAGDG